MSVFFHFLPELWKYGIFNSIFQQLQDRFWSFVFNKFVFVFGILNAVYVDEVIFFLFTDFIL